MMQWVVEVMQVQQQVMLGNASGVARKMGLMRQTWWETQARG